MCVISTIDSHFIIFYCNLKMFCTRFIIFFFVLIYVIRVFFVVAHLKIKTKCAQTLSLSIFIYILIKHFVL